MINKLSKKVIKFFKIFILRDKFYIAHRQWVKDQGDQTLRLEYDINEESIVFDLGGYHGDFTEKIYSKYGSTIYVFEPVQEYYEIIKNKFLDNEKVKVFNFGLSDRNESLTISVSESASSVYCEGDKTEEIELQSITEFIEKHTIAHIDLFKINIEGGEFAVLPELIKTGYIKQITNLQIQFHTFIDNAVEKREAIRNTLTQTHNSTYNYYFIWENWKNNVER